MRVEFDYHVTIKLSFTVLSNNVLDRFKNYTDMKAMNLSLSLLYQIHLVVHEGLWN